jgi:hypothetical protein
LDSSPSGFLKEQLPLIHWLPLPLRRLRHTRHLSAALPLQYCFDQGLSLLGVNRPNRTRRTPWQSLGGRGDPGVRVHYRSPRSFLLIPSDSIPRHIPKFRKPVFDRFPVSWFSKIVRHNMTPFKWLRDAVIVLILYIGWLGVMVIVTPCIAYLELRKQGASRPQAAFLSAVACLLISWLILLGSQ